MDAASPRPTPSLAVAVAVAVAIAIAVAVPGCHRPEPLDPPEVAIGPPTGPPPTAPLPVTTVYADDAPPWTPTDVLVSDPSATVTDPEFDVTQHHAAFGTITRELWVADWDPATGALDPPDLRGTLVDTDLAVFGGGAVRNGPEFVQSALGGEIVYARESADGAYVLMRAWFDGAGWATAPIDGEPARVAPLGSQEVGDPDPRVVWTAVDAPITSWSHLDGRFGGEIGRDLAHGPRFALGARALVWADEVDGVSQVQLYDEALDATTVLTDDPAPKGSPWMWVAPELGERLFLATLDDGEGRSVELDVYREVDGVWQVIKRIVPPADRPFVASPEAWIVGGRSVVVFQAKGAGSSEIWVASTAPGDDALRRCDGTEGGLAIDPEWAEVGGEAVVYYTMERQDLVTVRMCGAGFAAGR